MTDIDDDQMSFINGCTSSLDDNTIHYLSSNQTKGGIVSMDTEKAFDRTEQEYLQEVLRRFGLQSDFISWVQILYKMPTASVEYGKINR